MVKVDPGTLEIKVGVEIIEGLKMGFYGIEVVTRDWNMRECQGGGLVEPNSVGI